MNQHELFELTLEQKRLAAEKNPMCRKHGYFDGQTKCKFCKFICYTQPSNKKYFKCKHRGITKGAGTDHRVNWLACSKYEQVQCNKCWDDGKKYSHFDYEDRKRVYIDCPECKGGE